MTHNSSSEGFSIGSAGKESTSCSGSGRFLLSYNAICCSLELVLVVQEISLLNRILGVIGIIHICKVLAAVAAVSLAGVMT